MEGPNVIGSMGGDNSLQKKRGTLAPSETKPSGTRK